ncbi:unnamed protein product [Colias eurytheme]|nr:unnamed protein product [Colias eurytheme]
MIRRPLTEIKLKLEDLQEYENSRREAANRSTQEAKEDTPKTLASSKTVEEIHNRIGYTAKKRHSGTSSV